ncbi:MAG: hypothetical protein MSC31_05160 [Solirubrobacteraceae bacterium MAG38_C4-C5]|nr:hypothetical protein [Candidatus Siliceabacter maunaloa]
MRRPLTVLTASVPEDPVLDTALSSAVLEGVVLGGPPVLRLWAPGPGVSFGRLDRLLPGFPTAVGTARAAGFAAVMRVGGGRTAAAHEGALVFGLAAPVAEDTTRRFETMAGVLRRTLARVGVDAQRGELPGEYCPGAWSLHAGGVKLAGLAQRVRLRAAWTEGLLLVQGSDRVRDVLVPVHKALGLSWEPRTVGAAEDIVPGVTWQDAAQALRAELATRYELLDADIAPSTLAFARSLRERHDAVVQAERPPADKAGGTRRARGG